MTSHRQLERARRLVAGCLPPGCWQHDIDGVPCNPGASSCEWFHAIERASLALDGMPARGPYTSPPCIPVAPVPQSRACVDPKCPLVHPHFTLARRTPVAR